MGNLRVGFIGLGQMGSRMARRLADAQMALAVNDARPDAALDFGQAVRVCASPAEVAASSDIICTSLPGPIEAEEVFLGASGIVDALEPGRVCIDFSTNSPATVQRIAKEVADRGAELLDAPVSGGVEKACNGGLTVLVGGSARALETARPVLDVLSATVLHVGEVGVASICKVLHNCAVFCANLATMECLTVGVRAGAPAATLIEVFQESGLGRNLDLQVAMPATLFKGNFEPRFSMRLARKDMALAQGLAQQVGLAMPLADLCEQDMEEAIHRGWGDKDNTIFLTLREERADVQVRLPTTS